MESEESKNILWVKEILKNHWQEYPPSPGDSDENLEEASESSEADYTSINSKQQEISISEIEMRDDGYDTDNDNDTHFYRMSRIIDARITYTIGGVPDDERMLFWVVKIPSPFIPNRKIATFSNLYKREISFYVDILPVMKAWVDGQYIDPILEFHVPNCYHGTYNRKPDTEPELDLIERIEDAESILVLQDLRVFEYGKRHFGEGMSTAEALAAITEITKFHAVSYAMYKKEGSSMNFSEMFSPEGLVELYAPMFKRGARTFENFMSNCTSEVVTPAEKALMSKTIQQLEQNIKDLLPVLLAPTEMFPSTLIHLDLWSDNLLFHIKEEDRDNNVPPEEYDLDCVIIDWQMVSFGSPTHDLALLMMLSMDAHTRQTDAHKLLQYYYQYFEKILSWFELPMPFTFEYLRRNFETSCVLAVIMAISSMDLVIQDENAQNRLLLVLKDLFDDGILPVYDNNASSSKED